MAGSAATIKRLKPAMSGIHIIHSCMTSNTSDTAGSSPVAITTDLRLRLMNQPAQSHEAGMWPSWLSMASRTGMLIFLPTGPYPGSLQGRLTKIPCSPLHSRPAEPKRCQQTEAATNVQHCCVVTREPWAEADVWAW